MFRRSTFIRRNNPLIITQHRNGHLMICNRCTAEEEQFEYFPLKSQIEREISLVGMAVWKLDRSNNDRLGAISFDVMYVEKELIKINKKLSKINKSLKKLDVKINQDTSSIKNVIRDAPGNFFLHGFNTLCISIFIAFAIFIAFVFEYFKKQ
jgi:hypothetical protein